MAEPQPASAGYDAYATQLVQKDEQLAEAIEHRRAVIAGIESGEELRRCEIMLAALGQPEALDGRIAVLERRVHRVGEKRASLFGGFRLGGAREELELVELIRRRDAAARLRDRAAKLRDDPQAVKSQLQREVIQLEHRLARRRERRRAGDEV